MAERRQEAITWVAALGLTLVLGIGAFMLLGAAEPGDEVLHVDAAAYIRTRTAGEATALGTEEFVYLFLAVTSPTRGAVVQLQRGNIRVRDAYYDDSGGVAEYNEYRALQVGGFSSMGGGFYRVDVAPGHEWDYDQFVVLIEIECPWGRGITVCELPVGASGRKAVY